MSTQQPSPGARSLWTPFCYHNFLFIFLRFLIVLLRACPCRPWQTHEQETRLSVETVVEAYSYSRRESMRSAYQQSKIQITDKDRSIADCSRLESCGIVRDRPELTKSKSRVWQNLRLQPRFQKYCAACQRSIAERHAKYDCACRKNPFAGPAHPRNSLRH